MARRPARGLAPSIVSRLEELADLTSGTPGVTRLYLSPEHKQATEKVARWMGEAGLDVRLDATGTVVGRLDGTSASAKTLLIGSHIDSVIGGGRFDGCLGVVLAIEVLSHLRRNGIKLPYAVEILAFGDEEGVRFPFALTSSKAIAGEFDKATLGIPDGNGVTLREALVGFGCNPDAIASEARSSATILGYVEVHIEQGPVLEDEGLGVGVVTAISGASRFQITVNGAAGHAGTLPMHMRKDALAATAEMILAVERLGATTPALVATVGHLSVAPNAVNVVPGGAMFTLDVRSPMDRTRRTGIRQIERDLKAIARRRQVTVDIEETYDTKAAACDHRFIRHLTSAAERAGTSTTGLPSGAGHDGQALVELCPIGMLFVRCKGGISHHPDESVRTDDIEIAARTLAEFLKHVSLNGRSIA